MKTVMTSFVRCPVCYYLNKPSATLMPVVSRCNIKNKFMHHFINGIKFNIPLCCVIYFCYKSIKTGAVAGLVRRERGLK